MISLVSFFQSLGTPSETSQQISSLSREVRRIQEYWDNFDKDEFEADFILTADVSDLQDLDTFEYILNMRTLEHLHHIFRYLEILNTRLKEFQNLLGS